MDAEGMQKDRRNGFAEGEAMKGVFIRKRIMIADDDLDLVYNLSVVLENAGYEVSSTLDGTYVVEGEYEYPDIYLVDKSIPDLDGLEICRQLRARKGAKDIPIVIISGAPGVASLALAAGANAFLEKPFASQELLRLIENLTGRTL